MGLVDAKIPFKIASFKSSRTHSFSPGSVGPGLGLEPCRQVQDPVAQALIPSMGKGAMGERLLEHRAVDRGYGLCDQMGTMDRVAPNRRRMSSSSSAASSGTTTAPLPTRQPPTPARNPCLSPTYRFRPTLFSVR